jgi:hypothetical protein
MTEDDERFVQREVDESSEVHVEMAEAIDRACGIPGHLQWATIAIALLMDPETKAIEASGAMSCPPETRAQAIELARQWLDKQPT